MDGSVKGVTVHGDSIVCKVGLSWVNPSGLRFLICGGEPEGNIQKGNYKP